ncbi:probable JLP2 DnaJ-Like Protein 2 [Cephalotrichum gorgonifer]|uniref:Probable JLP2 DnaJ-Like Protein 2 n=1 Tax=Cephalotrichum gorgonifer TaxID=2041049 RepID=A0AAE8N336_9PEZI|nr:probable JLP2 DnaJ-Like Protein 2 [Cephalotrichum gorgonifer]
MVYYHTSTATDPPSKLYVGKDKFENEELIKYAWDTDVWFHVDKLSSAHVYLRMTDDQAWDALPRELLDDLAQLTKANSIEGNKKDNVAIIYTPASNLKKDGSMDVGQVSFHDNKKVKRIFVPQRENAIVNRLNKTRVEAKPDLKQEKDDRDKILRRAALAEQQERKKEEARKAQEYKEKKWQKDHAYDDLFTEEGLAMSSNQDRNSDWEDDFM